MAAQRPSRDQGWVFRLLRVENSQKTVLETGQVLPHESQLCRDLGVGRSYIAVKVLQNNCSSSWCCVNQLSPYREEGTADSGAKDECPRMRHMPQCRGTSRGVGGLEAEEISKTHEFTLSKGTGLIATSLYLRSHGPPLAGL